MDTEQLVKNFLIFNTFISIILLENFTRRLDLCQTISGLLTWLDVTSIMGSSYIFEASLMYIYDNTTAGTQTITNSDIRGILLCLK